jgi:outer membrane receptor protein involved in Fe transport
MSKRSGLLLLKLLTTCLFTNSLLAGPTATLTGRVTNPSGTVVAGVRVEATNVETNVTFTGETNAEGRYYIPDLPPGTYRVIVQKFAFVTIVKPNVELHVQDLIALNFSIEVGSVVESVTVEEGAPLIQASPQRGGDFVSREARDLPLVLLNPVTLARTLPGVLELPGTSLPGTFKEAAFSVNGQRPTANNYLLDSTDNNQMEGTGIAQPFNIADAVEEVSVQAGNSGVEFGRAGGGIFNVVTKPGTNWWHGTLLWRYQSQLFDSVSNVDKLNHQPQTALRRNVYGFTMGGPLRKNKTFFFVSFQQDTRRSNPFKLVVPTEAAVGTLRSLFPSNPRLDLYLGFLGDLRGTASPFRVPLGDDPGSGVDRGTVQFATAPLALVESQGGPQWLVRLDHNLSEAHHLAFRYIYGSDADSPSSVTFPGFVTDNDRRNQNFLFADRYTFSPSWTNEFRFSYARSEWETGRIAPQSVPEARWFPRIGISPIGHVLISAPGLNNDERFLRSNNLLFQETQTKLSGRHSFRYGVEFLRQVAAQYPIAWVGGNIIYPDGGGYSGFANFLDDFSGPSGRMRKDFDVKVFHPDQFHQAYFFQDTWLPVPSLSLTLGLRYENFGQVANALKYPAFAGFDPANFLKPNRVDTDNKDFGPAFGLAWSPTFRSSWLRKLFGENKTVWRGGYQISYDAPFTGMLSLLLAAAAPNGNGFDTTNTLNTDRGSPNWYEQFWNTAPDQTLKDAQLGAIEKDFRNPYTERWSFGFQRQLSNKMVLDGSYVGSESHRLTTWADVNPRQPDGQPLHPDFGPRQIRTSQGNSSYNALQWRLDRRFARGFQVTASYTWSRNIDSTSEGVATVNNQEPGANRTSIPVAQGGLKLDRGPSDYDRTQRFTIAYIWDVPGLGQGILKRALGGWSISGITTFQSGAPLTVSNGLPRNNYALGGARPDIGNPTAPLNSRAVASQFCATGYRNPDTDLCVTRDEVHWVQAVGPPDASTVGRNTLVAGGINNFDVSLSRSFGIGEQRRLAFRWEAFNALNHPQFTQIPDTNVNNPALFHFLNRDFTDSGIRSMWVQVKLIF